MVEVIDPIPVTLDAAELLQNLRPQRLKEELATLLEQSRSLIEPKAALTKTRVVSIENEQVSMEDGHTLRGVVLGDMLERGQEIVVYVATIGSKLENKIDQVGNRGDLLRSYLIDRIGNYALHRARASLKVEVARRLAVGHGYMSEFSPGTGTGELFGLEQQKSIFGILGSASESIGVRLTRSLLMLPQKSVSGVLAATRQEYLACAHCPRDACENRVAPFLGEYRRIRKSRGSLR